MNTESTRKTEEFLEKMDERKYGRSFGWVAHTYLYVNLNDPFFIIIFNEYHSKGPLKQENIIKYIYILKD